MFSSIEPIIMSVNITSNSIEVIERYPSNRMYACIPPRPVPDKIIKKIYAVDQFGSIYLKSTQEGKHIPAEMKLEEIVFEE